MKTYIQRQGEVSIYTESPSFFEPNRNKDRVVASGGPGDDRTRNRASRRTHRATQISYQEGSACAADRRQMEQ